jgi:hypothetical protein
LKRRGRADDAFEGGVADPGGPTLKDRIDGLEVIRDQARADADRAQSVPRWRTEADETENYVYAMALQ